MAKWETIGTVLAKKDGKGTYIKMKKDVHLREGTIVQVQDPRDTVDVLLGKGVITSDQAADRKSKIPDFVKFDLVLPPPQSK